jgi:amino acid adenylation domain-containing protein
MGDTGFPLSAVQRDVLGEPATDPALRVSAVRAVPADVAAEEVQERLAAALGRYEIFRTGFVRPAGLQQLVQVPHEVAEPSWIECTADSVEQGLQGELAADLDPASGRPLRAALITVGDDRWIAVTALSAVADPRTLELLLDEIVDGSGAGTDPLQYADYSEWEAEQLNEDSATARIARAFWADAFPDDPPQRRYPTVLRAASPTVAEPRVAPPSIWLAAWCGVLIGHGLAQDDLLVVDVGVDGRVDDELADAIGPYERFVPLAVTVERGLAADALSARLTGGIDAARRFCMFAPPSGGLAAFSRHAAPVSVGARDRASLEVECFGQDDAAEVVLWHDPAVIASGYADRMADHLHRAAAEILARPAVDVRAIALVSPAEADQIEGALCGTGNTGLPAVSIVAGFAATATAVPDQAAVVLGEDTLTYAELDRASAAVAAALSQRCAKGEPVGLFTPQSISAVVGMLAILRAGCVYVPLNPTQPAARLSAQVAAGGIAVALAPELIDVPVPTGLTVLAVDELAAGGSASPDRPLTADDIAYLIFTSGSTGVPKPVAVTHGNVMAYVAAVTDRLGLHPGDRLATTTPLTTDLGNTSVFPALLGGGTLELIPADVIADGRALADLVRAHRIDAIKLTPSYLRALLAEPSVRIEVPLLIVGGEALDWSLMEQARDRGAARVVNHYGPTETTVGVFTHEPGVDSSTSGATVPLGRPLGHVRATILDADGRVAPYGVPGELGICGPSVAVGYWNQPEETAARFVPAPDGRGDRMYRTGDRARLLEDGTVEFLGRIDSQIKVRGYRVELGEIESQLRSHPSIAEAAVVVDDADPDVLVGYIVIAEGATAPPAAELADLLAVSLPPYMVPRQFYRMADLPRTASGKLDRNRLAPPAEAAAARELKSPTTPTESDLLEIWQAVLARPDISTDDNFFQIGGHSLLATRIVARARSHFDLELPLHVIFASPSIESLAADIDERRAAIGADEDVEAMLAEIESLSDDEAERLLHAEADAVADED